MPLTDKEKEALEDLAMQQTRKKVVQGCDYGAPIRVLAVKGRRELWWRKGHTGWMSRGETGYYPGCLFLADLDGHKYGDIPETTELQEGGRLGRPMFERHAEAIDAFFGESVAKHLHPNKTVEILK